MRRVLVAVLLLAAAWPSVAEAHRPREVQARAAAYRWVDSYCRGRFGQTACPRRHTVRLQRTFPHHFEYAVTIRTRVAATRCFAAVGVGWAWHRPRNGIAVRIGTMFCSA